MLFHISVFIGHLRSFSGSWLRESFATKKPLEKYILSNSSQITSECYYSLIEIARSLEDNDFFLASSLIFRSLINHILNKAKSKVYHYAIDYVEYLEKIKNKIKNWKKYDSHESFMNNLHEKHKRKYSFWNRLEEFLNLSKNYLHMIYLISRACTGIPK